MCTIQFSIHVKFELDDHNCLKALVGSFLKVVCELK